MNLTCVLQQAEYLVSMHIHCLFPRRHFLPANAGRRNFQQFLEQYSAAVPGTFVDVESGEDIGLCKNILTVTLGQKAGLGGQKER